MESQSPLDAHADDIVRMHLLGVSYTSIARHLTEAGVPTTRHSVRRFFERFRGPTEHFVHLGAIGVTEIIDSDLSTRENTAMPPPQPVREDTPVVREIKARSAQGDERGGFSAMPKEEAKRPTDPVVPNLGAMNWPSQNAATNTTTGTAQYVVWSDKPLMREMEIKVPKPTKAKTEWGYGAAKLVPVNRTAFPDEIVVFLSDIHFPYQDQELVDQALTLIDRIDCHRVVLNGDINDFFQLSRFNTSLERLDHLQEEIDEANAFRRRLREVAGDAIIDETEGNHDERIRTFVQRNAKALHTLDAIKPNKLFCYDELEINWHPGAGFLLRPEFLVKHGTLLRSECPNTAKAELMAANISGISGHTHRLGTYRRAGYAQRQWTEQGGLMRMDPDYVIGIPNWTQGMCIGEFSTSTSSFRIHEVPAVDGKLSLFGGHL